VFDLLGSKLAVEEEQNGQSKMDWWTCAGDVARQLLTTACCGYSDAQACRGSAHTIPFRDSANCRLRAGSLHGKYHSAQENSGEERSINVDVMINAPPNLNSNRPTWPAFLVSSPAG
jgi:hypothetical protein